MSDNDAFLHWLAGFIDGEGHFGITGHGRGAALSARFKLSVRDDDLAIIEEIRRRTGIGFIRRIPQRGRNNAKAEWAVASGRDMATLVRILETHPLRAKKQRDFHVWKRAVRITSGRTHGGAYNNPAKQPALANLAWRMVQLKAELEAIRSYVPPDEPVGPPGADSDDVSLFDTQGIS